MFPKESAGATKERIISDEPSGAEEKTVISRLAAKLITTGNNSWEAANLSVPRPEGWGLVRVNEEAGRKRLSSF
jgi:hypothetical protein